MKRTLLFVFTLTFVNFLQAQVLINEIDADQSGTDEAEFVELYNTSSSEVSLDGYVLVLFNGSNDQSYAAYDLDGYNIAANGYFVIGAVDEADMALTSSIQNGADAVALYMADETDFPDGTAVTLTDIVDAVVYGTNDSDDSGLLTLLNTDEPQLNDDTSNSLQRNTDGEGGARNTSNFVARNPTPGATNNVTVGVLELTSPNGGGTYNAGQQVQFAWNSTDVSNVFFEVWTDEMEWEQITDNMASVDGANTYDFDIPANAWTWDGYKLRVVDADNTTVNDESDAVFSIDGHDTEVFWENFGNGTLGGFEAISVSGTEAWEYGIFSGKTFAQIDGNGNDNEDWLITPVINLDDTKDETLEFETAVNTVSDNLEVKYSTDYDGQGDPASATWMDLPSYELSPGSWEFKRTIVDISSYSGNIYFAFIYTSSAAIDNKWEVTGIYVSGVDDTATNLNTKQVSKIIISPNPFDNEIQVKASNDVQSITLYNAVGQVVKIDNAGVNRLVTTDLSKGMYILHVKLVDGSTSVQKVIKK